MTLAYSWRECVIFGHFLPGVTTRDMRLKRCNDITPILCINDLRVNILAQLLYKLEIPAYGGFVHRHGFRRQIVLIK